MNSNNKVKVLNSIAYMLYSIDPDSTILFARQAIALSKKNKLPQWRSECIRQ